MAVTIIPFTPLQSPDYFKEGYNIADLVSQTKQRNIQNQYLPESLQIANALKQNELQYAPQMSEAELALKQKMAPYYGALTGEAGARTKEMLQKIENPNLGQAGDLGTIAYGKWLKQHHPDIYIESTKNIPGTKDIEQSLDVEIPSLPSSFNGKGVGIPTSQAPTIPSGIANFNIPQMQPFVPKQFIPGTPATQQMIQQPVGQSLIQAGLQSAQSKPELMQAKLTGGMGGYGGVGIKEQRFFESLVARDNPNLTPDQVYEASNVLAEGGNTLQDGTPVKMTPASQASLDRLTKAGTTTFALNQGIKGKQAEKEIDVLEDYARKGLAPYGDTYKDYSPQQIMDTFKSDDQSQKRLGRFIGAQGLSYEVAQQRIKLASGEPGVTSTNELINLSKQTINALYPRLSAKAREEASNYMSEALKQGFEARQSVGVGASRYRGGEAKSNKEEKVLSYNPETGKLE